MLNRHLSASESTVRLKQLKVLVKVVGIDEKIINLALSDDSFRNFEDALQYFAAMGADVHVLLTRNKKDFKNANILILSAREFLANPRFNPPS